MYALDLFEVVAIYKDFKETLLGCLQDKQIGTNKLNSDSLIELFMLGPLIKDWIWCNM